MIIAGNCFIANKDDIDLVIATAQSLKSIADLFRVKVIGGGTRPDRYNYGFVVDAVETIQECNKIIPTITEVHTPSHINRFNYLPGLWIGARNCQNYSLLESFKFYAGKKFIKRNMGMTVKELCDLYDVCKEVLRFTPWIIERGTIDISRDDNSRWSITLNDVLKLKNDRPDIFDRLVVDCSHSTGRSEFVGDCYEAMKAIGVQHFMFECTVDGSSSSDARQMISVNKLKNILEGK